MRRVTFPLVALLLPAAGASAQTLWVIPPDEPSPCSFAQLEEALASVQPALAVRSGPPADASADITVTVGTVGKDTDNGQDHDGLLLTVSAPGAAPLRRALPKPDKSCAATSQAAAFMVARYLQDISWQEQPAPSAPPAPPAPPAPLEPTVQHQAFRPFRADAEASIGGTYGQAGVLPAVALSFGLRPGEWFSAWELSAGGEIVWPGRQVAVSDDTFHDTFQTQTVRFEVAAGRRVLTVGASSLWIDLGPGLELNWSNDLDYAPADPGFRPRGMADLSARWELPLGEKLALAVRLEGRLLFGKQPLTPAVDDGDSDDDPSLINGDCGLSLAVSYFLF